MRSSLSLLLLLLALSSTIIAEPHNRLMKIKSISAEKRSFVTRQGRFDGIVKGTTLVFKAKGVSFSAKANAVSRFYTQWDIVNPSMTMPIKPGEYVVAYKGEEYIWSHHDGNMITEKHREAMRKPASWLSGNFYYIRGLSESISNVKDDVEVSRNGFGYQFGYTSEFTKKLYWSVNLRYETETIDIKAGTLSTSRIGFTGSIFYLSQPLLNFYKARFMTGLGLGFTTSNTTSATTSQSGSALILPSLDLGFLFRIDDRWSWSAGSTFESISTKEAINSQTQSTDQLNMKIMIGVHRFFNGLTEY